jgi:uncharacterized membrane protein YgcG
MSRIIPIFTYLQSVQVNVVERAVDARCQIMRHLDTPLALPRVISLALAGCSLARSPSPTTRRDTSVAHSLDPSFSSTATRLSLSLFLSFSLPFSPCSIFSSYGLAVREPDKNTRAEKERSAQLGSLNAPTHRKRDSGGRGGGRGGKGGGAAGGGGG